MSAFIGERYQTLEFNKESSSTRCQQINVHWRCTWRIHVTFASRRRWRHCRRLQRTVATGTTTNRYAACDRRLIDNQVSKTQLWRRLSVGWNVPSAGCSRWSSWWWRRWWSVGQMTSHIFQREVEKRQRQTLTRVEVEHERARSRYAIVGGWRWRRKVVLSSMSWYRRWRNRTAYVAVVIDNDVFAAYSTLVRRWRDYFKQSVEQKSRINLYFLQALDSE